MAITYKILGGDGNQYGPVELDGIQSWVREGRVGPTTQVQRSDRADWLPANRITEIQVQPEAEPNPAPVPAVAPTADPVLEHLEKQVKSGASWFYWIAGLSLVNSVVTLAGGHGGFVIGLGVTQVIDLLAASIGGAGMAVAIVLDLLAAGLFVLFGVFANRRQAWGFVAGMVLYALDGLVFLLLGGWLAVGFHAFALFCIFGGFTAMRKLQDATRQGV
jgi:hypothetical protein